MSPIMYYQSGVCVCVCVSMYFHLRIPHHLSDGVRTENIP